VPAVRRVTDKVELAVIVLEVLVRQNIIRTSALFVALAAAALASACGSGSGTDTTPPTTPTASSSSSQGVGTLKIEDIVVGTGAEAKAGDTVTVDYTGWLTNGTKFDSSIGKTPLVFVLGVGQVIKGWDQGVVGMKVGGKRTLTIPPDLAYGAQGAGNGVIPSNATLVFDVELLKAN
jgi:FKBP-type peptidyl-prolyl cis-trans isomerase